MKHVKAEYPSGDAVVVYDGSRISVEEVITAIQGERPDFEVFVQRDVPLP